MMQAGVPTNGTHQKEDEENMAKKAQAAQAPQYHKRVAEQVARAVLYGQRLDKLLKDVEPWKQDKLTAAVNKVREDIGAVIAQFEALPKGWRPATLNTGLQKGDKVRIADKEREKYASWLPADQMDDMTVESVVGPKVVVSTKGGFRSPFPRGHLYRAEAK